jgi:tRNA pseudouridine55 synthase
MDGKRLYDYAREGIPLPREIPSRRVQIYGLDLLSYPDERTIPDPCLQEFGFRLGDTVTPTTVSDSSVVVVNGDHSSAVNDDEDDKNIIAGSNNVKEDTQEGVQEEKKKKTFRPKKFTDPALTDPNHVPIPPACKGDKSLYFHIRVHCSSGTYIRTLIADIASHLGTVGLMTDLLRVEQSGFRLGGSAATLEMKECEDLERVEEAIQAGNQIWEERMTRQLREK